MKIQAKCPKFSREAINANIYAIRSILPADSVEVFNFIKESFTMRWDYNLSLDLDYY